MLSNNKLVVFVQITSKSSKYHEADLAVYICLIQHT